MLKYRKYKRNMTSADASTTPGSYLPGGPSSSWQKTSFYFKQMSSGLMRMKKMLIINQYGEKKAYFPEVY